MSKLVAMLTESDSKAVERYIDQVIATAVNLNTQYTWVENVVYGYPEAEVASVRGEAFRVHLHHSSAYDAETKGALITLELHLGSSITLASKGFFPDVGKLDNLTWDISTDAKAVSAVINRIATYARAFAAYTDAGVKTVDELVSKFNEWEPGINSSTT